MAKNPGAKPIMKSIIKILQNREVTAQANFYKLYQEIFQRSF